MIDINKAPAIVVAQENLPPLRFRIVTQEQASNFVASPIMAYNVVHAGIMKILEGEKKPEDMTPEKRRLSQLMRTTVKGALMMFGDNILNMMFGSKDHPRPEKKDDIIEWYSDIFAKYLVAEATQHIAVFYTRGNFGDTLLIIDEFIAVADATEERSQASEGA